jgi:hypothetical protein
LRDNLWGKKGGTLRGEPSGYTFGTPVIKLLVERLRDRQTQ